MRHGSVWLSFTVLWASYSLIFVGYCWLRGYDISFLQAVSPVNYYQGSWPPGSFTGTGVFPTGMGGSQVFPSQPSIVSPQQAASVPKPGQGGRFG